MPEKKTERAEALFPLGTILVTPLAAALLTDQEIFDALGRHQSGDWGIRSQWECRMNDHAVSECDQIISRYRHNHFVQFLVITYSDRSCTEVLLGKELEPDEDLRLNEAFDDHDWLEESES